MQAQSHCTADEIAARNALRFPDLATQRIQLQQAMDQFLAHAPATPRSVITIPVVVHVVYQESQDNISEEQIHSQIDVLNEDYRKLNANAGAVPSIFAPLAADMEIEFCLTAQDPSGQATNGITRRETSWSHVGDQIAPDGRPRINYTNLGGEDSWAPNRFLNIWVARIDDGVLGFGTFPASTPPAEDGVVIDPRFFGRSGLTLSYPPNNLGRTATHEIGHYFNLRHIWGGNNNSCNDDDDVNDTPVQRSAFLGCPSFPQLSCGNSAMFMNFMDYTDDPCMALFTLGQKSRLWAALTVARPGLLDSVFCTTTPVYTAPAPSGFKLFPNPAVSQVWLELLVHSAKAAFFSIADLQGKIWKSGQLEHSDSAPQGMDISALPPGFYVCRLSADDGFYMQSFVKM